MQRREISSGWQFAAVRDIQAYDPSLDIPGGEQVDMTGWLPVTMPTTAQAALVENGRAPEPWKDRNADLFREYEEDTWWFRTSFELPDGFAAYELELEAVSLFATVWVNGRIAGFISNAHHPHRFDVTDLVQTGGNTVAIECRLNIVEMKKRMRDDISATGDKVRSYVRLCQMSFGWDFAPRLLVAGPWRPVSVICHRESTIENVYVRTNSVNGGTAELVVESGVVTHAPASEPATLYLSVHEDVDGPAVWETSVQVAGNAPIQSVAKIENAKLWHPNGYGEAFLYTLKLRLERDGKTVDERTRRFGVRTLDLKQDNQFTFCINGVDVFSRGANWVPSNTLTLDSPSDHYAYLLDVAQDAGFNMLRVWGGGTYEPDEFYDLCDERGIMVWQDFMYACAMYPDDDPAFMESVRRESESAVMRLRGHACIVLWCGENENADTWAGGYEWYKIARRHFGARIYEQLLPGIVNRLDPATPWWPGSPIGGPVMMSLQEGDYHDWYGLPDWKRYDTDAPRFSSEYGFRSVPARETVDAMISENFQWDPNGPLHNVWDYHHGNCGWMKTVLADFGDPKTLDDFIMLTQEVQATLMRYAVECYRRRMFETSGSLIWQYNEPWPAVTFSLVDFFGRQKAAYWWVRDAHSPVISMFYEGTGHLAYWGISDLLGERPCTVSIRRFRHDGELLAEHVFESVLAANGSKCLLEEMPDDLTLQSPADEFLAARIECDGIVNERVWHSGHRKDWNLVPAEIAIDVERVDDRTARVRLVSPAYVHFVSVSVADPKARYSTNFIDLLPGEEQVIEVQAENMDGMVVRSANAVDVTL
jgi:beta-mannosidase